MLNGQRQRLMEADRQRPEQHPAVCLLAICRNEELERVRHICRVGRGQGLLPGAALAAIRAGLGGGAKYVEPGPVMFGSPIIAIARQARSHSSFVHFERAQILWDRSCPRWGTHRSLTIPALDPPGQEPEILPSQRRHFIRQMMPLPQAASAPAADQTCLATPQGYVPNPRSCPPGLAQISGRRGGLAGAASTAFDPASQRAPPKPSADAVAAKDRPAGRAKFRVCWSFH